MLFSKEMEGRGILRFTQADQRVVYCLNDLCHLLGIKYSNKIRGELHNKYVYFLTVKENGKLIKMRFVDISNLNILSRFVTDTAKAESFSKWFSEEIFPLSMKDDVFNLETITDMNVAMALLSEYEDLKFKVRQDWNIIHKKIASGKAHEISESDTEFLAACTKGANSKILVEQYSSEIKAKPRAYSFKSSYMTYLYRNMIHNIAPYSPLISEDEWMKNPLEEIYKEKMAAYHGMTQAQLSRRFGP